jgi:hypothetical protein
MQFAILHSKETIVIFCIPFFKQRFWLDRDLFLIGKIIQEFVLF